MAKSIREYVMISYNELEEDKVSLRHSIDVVNSEIKSIDCKIDVLETELNKLKMERQRLVVDRDKYEDLIKADSVTRIALRDFMRNRYNETI